MLDQRLKTRVEDFVSRLEREDVCLHGFMLSVGGEIKAVAFVRFEKGEGLEKREDNFADEVAGMMK